MNKLFHIFKLTNDDALKISSHPDEPHNHDFEELIIVNKGQVEHFIDFEAKNYNAPLVSFVTKGKVHRVIPKPLNGECDIWAIRFKSEFVPESTFQLYSYYHNNATIVFEEGFCFERLLILCDLMYKETQQPTINYAIIRQLLSTIFTMIETERKKHNEDTIKIQQTSFKKFLSELELHFREPFGVDFYAEKLSMSTRNLNHICQNIMEQSVSEIIETRKLIEAKNLLITSDKTISEIGFELGYNEKAYFTNVFKKKSGVTPSEFRDEMRKLLLS